MILGHTVNEEFLVGGKAFFLGGAGQKDFSSCPSCLLLRVNLGK